MATAAMKPAVKKRKAPMPRVDTTTARELATHAANIEHMQYDIDRVLSEMAEMRVCLNKINTTLSEAKGGWKVLMMMGGGAGIFGAALTQFFHSIPWSK